MKQLRLQRHWRGCVLFLLVAAVSNAHSQLALALTPESPEVKAMVEKGVAYISERNNAGNRLGELCLYALALHKGGKADDHPLIKRAVALCKKYVKTPDVERNQGEVYDISVALILLCELDSSEYNEEITTFLSMLEKRQKKHGGWGYVSGTHAVAGTGDTSMTQYAVLAIWTAHQHGVVISWDSVSRVTLWLMRTQDPSGAWGYQGRDPANFERVQQEGRNLRLSLATAALGSIYLCVDLLKLGVVQNNNGLPAALKRVEKPEEENKVNNLKTAQESIPRVVLTRVMADGNRNFKNKYRIDPTERPYYYIYTLERSMSLQDHIAGRNVKEPAWYNAGVRHLQGIQLESGAWGENLDAQIVSTSFAVLFLTRSMNKTLKNVKSWQGDGLLSGGRGLPGNTSSVQIREGKIVGTPVQADAGEMLSILEDSSHPDFESLVASDSSITLSGDASTRAAQRERLYQLSLSGPPETRILAIKAISHNRDMSGVPKLIKALNDRELRVAIAARDGLRFLSRRFDGFGLPDNPTRAQQRLATAQWQRWYSALSPNADEE